MISSEKDRRMTLFLTSSPFDGWGGPLTNKNKFAERLGGALSRSKTGLFIASDPSDHTGSERFAEEVWKALAEVEICFCRSAVLDGENASEAESLVMAADFIVLAGGHVPTQNKFFHDIRLPELMTHYSGVVMGISAGTMNSASTVYAQPELEGECVDPDYQRFLTGLGLTDVMILPHYYDYKDSVLDGLRVYEDVTYPDSVGRQFYAMPDGSYLYKADGKEMICGEAWLISDGSIKKINTDGEEFYLS